ncbi:ATP-binding protein [Aeromonas bivalvium]|uniref:ATP-binding protein n=1 Tax=Aeromonas bivalvium TaxID=440079 RepID=UPI00370C0DE1
MKLGLQGRFLLILCFISLLQLILLSTASYYYVSEQRYREIGDQALDVAQLVARNPAVIAQVRRADTARLNPLVERIRADVGASFIVIGDSNALRLVHPRADRIGKPMVGDDPTRALVHGESYVSHAQGSLGVSVRGKTPIRDELGQIIGVVSVGYLVRDIDADLRGFLRFGLFITLLIVLLNSLAAGWLARRYKKAIFGFEPEQIGRLYAELDCTLRTVREGILTIDGEGRLTSLNPNGIKLLRLEEGQARRAIGRPVNELLPETRMLSLIDDPTPQYDEEIWLNGQQLIVNRLPLVRGGELIGAVSSFRRKDELAELTAQLSQVQAYSDLLRVQTHEHNNQLGTIAGLIELGAYEEALAFIGREAETEQTLLAFLMEAIAKPKVAALLLGKYHRAHELGLELIVEPGSRLHDIPARVSGSQLVTLLGNLIDNAFEATRRHGAPYQPIRVSLSDLGQDLVLEVEDGAGGVDPALVDRLFEPGVSCKAEPGHGIGLALVRKTLDALKGQIHIEPTERGSCFVCYIPKDV